MAHNRGVHDEQNQKIDEGKMQKKGKQKPFINQVFGHGQQALKGYPDCGKKLRQALAQETAEGNASTEFACAVKTVPNTNAQKGDDIGGFQEETVPEPESHKTDDEDGDIFEQSQCRKIDPEILERAQQNYRKLKVTISKFPRPLVERGYKIVEILVKSDEAGIFPRCIWREAH